MKSETPQAAHDWSKHKWVEPEKLIKEQQDLEKFKKSQSHNEYMNFVMALQHSVEGKGASKTQLSPKFKLFIELIQRLNKLVDEVPPIQQKMRFGNTAFKTWHQKAMEIGNEFFDKYLPEAVKGSKTELLVYFMDSFGSNVRLDYGTGHELNFAQILFCLRKMGVYGDEDYESAVHHVFFGYIKLMRKIQTVYWLEPAGSQGVWGLDDHHFLPFLFGAAELIGHEEAKLPNAIHNEALLDSMSDDYMYMSKLESHS